MDNQEKEIYLLTVDVNFLLREVKFLTSVINRLEKKIDDLERSKEVSIIS